MKKVLSIVMVVVMLLSSTVTVGAITENQTEPYEGSPLVVVRGIDFGGFYLVDGTPAINFKASYLLDFVKDFYQQLIVEKNENAFLDSALGVVGKIFEPISIDKAGKSLYEVYYDQYEYSMAHYTEEINFMENTGETGIIKTAIDRIGAENVYYFTYDWRMSAEDMAADLSAYIDNVLFQTGEEKVNIIAVSMGGMVTTAYLNYHGSENVNNLVYVSSAHNGTYSLGDSVNGNICLNADTVYARARRLVENKPLRRLLVDIIDRIGVFDALATVANKVIENNPQALNNDVLREKFGTITGLWALCPDDVFESGVDFLYKGYEKEYSALLKTLGETKKFVFSTEKIIDSAIENGVNVSFVSNYGSPLAPFFKNSDLQSDSVVETKFTSNFATVAPYGQILSEEQIDSAQAEYLSPDKIIDASTALYRDMTWFVKGAPHVAAEYGSEYADFVIWLILSDEQPTINSSEDYPQFMVLGINKELTAAE